MKPSKGGVRSYYFVVLVSVFILFASNPLSAADSSTISQTTREDSTSSADSARDDSTGAGVKSNGVAGISRGSPESSISADSASANFAAPEGGSTAGGGAATSISNPTIDTFQFTGAAMAKVPIVVPPGRNRIQPNLNLIYNSFQKNGWIGVGWSLDVGSIQRSTRYGVDYQADDYVVVQERSSSELVERSDWGPGYFGAKIEGGFAKYQLNGDDGWEVTAKNGAKYFYGTAPASRQHDADDNSRIFKWCLDRVEDTNGNFMTFSYTKDQGEIYLDRIDYTGNVGRNPTNYVKFHLEPERRPDVSVMYDGNFRVTTAKRLRTIEVQGNGEIARAYTFTYKDNQNTFHSLLSFIEVYGSNAVIDDDGMVLSGTRLPRIGIEYQDSALGANDELWINRPVSSSNGPFESGYGDFNGDGKTDYAYRQKNTNQFHVMLSTGTSFVDELWINRPVSSSNGPYEGGYGDFNGDGKTDYAYRQKNTNQFHVMLSTGTSFVDELWINRPVSSSNGPYEGGYGDFNGDGKTDYAYRQKNTNQFHVMLSTGTSFVDELWINRPVSSSNGPFEGGYGDFNGDGKTDYAYRQKNTNQFHVMLSTGTSFVDELWINRPVSSSNGPYEGGYGDFNGDGKTDYAYRQKNTNQFHVMLSTGTSFVDELWINRPVSSSNGPYEGGYGDFNGDGKTDYAYRQNNTNQFHVMLSTGTSFVDELWINRPVSSSNGPYEGGYGDFNGDGKTDYAYRQQNTQKFRVMLSTGQIPDLVSEIDNGLGKKTTLSYTPSSEYQNERLPFIIQTVSSVTMDDGNPLGTQTTTAYKYSGGLFDLVSRELRGFETVTQTSAVGSPFEIITETKFHQDGFLKGRPDRIEVKLPEETGALLSKTIFSWDKEFLDPPEDSYAFVKLQQKLTESYDGVTVSSQEDFAYDDANGNLLSKTTSGTDGEDVTITYQYSNLGDWLWRKAQETLKNESQQVVREIYFQYWDDGTGNLRFKEFRLNGQANPKMEMTYDSYGNQKTVIDPRGYSTTTDYDTATRTYPVKITYPETGGVSHIVENEAWDYRFGKVIITKDENGNRTYYDYDEFGRPVQVDSPSGGQAITEYYDDVFPRFVVTKVKENASGSTIDSYQYFDGLGRVIQGITLGEAGKAIVTKLFYDELGRNDLVEGPFFEPSRDYVANPPTHSDYPLNPSGVCPWQQTSFDPRGRPVSIESADGEYGSVVATFSYSGLSATVIDPDEGSKTETKDYLGRIIQVIEHGDGAAYTTSYTYNAAGDLLTVNDHYKNTTTVNYDTLGRKLSMNDPDMGYWEYTYDPNGNLLTQTDEKLQTVTFAYDELNRVTSKTYSTSDPTVTYIYDNLTIANGRGRLRSVSNTQVTTTYNAYDEMGNVTSVSKTITGDATLYTTQYEYDLSGKVTKTIYPDGYHVSNAFYAGTGLLHAVTGSDAVEYARLSDYEPTGKIGLIEHANGILTSYTYDPESTRLTSIVTARPGPAIDLQNKTYRYTGAGDIKEIIDDVKSITYNYTYDRFHRLTGETNTGAYDPISYTYNATGNIMSKTVGSTTLAYTYDTWHKHAVKTINFSGNDHNYTYDDNGNMTAGPDFTDPLQVAARTIGYNADNMPTSISHVKGGHTVTTDFIYDGDGVRSKKIVEGSSTAYYIGAHFEIKDGVATKFIFAGNLRIAKAAASGTHYFHKDHLGSSTVMTDATGAAVETTDYMPFGSQRDPTGTDVSNYKFTDQEFDAESGLYNYNARLYDPIIGRFISADPFVQAPFDPQTLNRYSYCRNNPLIYIDPSGYGFFSDLWDKAKSFVKNATKFVASTITNTVLSNVIFSIWDVPFPGLGVAIRIGIAYASNFAGDQVAGAIENGGSSTNSGAGFNGGGNVSSSQFGNNSIGATIDGSVPYANYSQNYGGNFDYKSAYSANIVSQGHKCDSAFHEALNNIYRGVIKGAGHFFTDGSKAVKDASIATYDLALNGPPLAKTALWIAAATEAIPFAAAIGYYSVTVGYPSFMIAAGTKGGQYFLLNIVDALSPTPPITPGGGVIKYYEWMRRQGLW